MSFNAPACSTYEVLLLPSEQAMLTMCLAPEPVPPAPQTQLVPPPPLAEKPAEQAGGRTEQQQEQASAHSAQQDQQGQPDQQMLTQIVRRSSAYT